MRSPLVRAVLAVAVLVAPASLAAAQVVTHTVPLTTPSLGAPYSTTFTVPLFDPALGHLTHVEGRLSGSVDGSLAVENLGGSPASVTAYVGVNATVGLPGIFGLLSNPAYEVYGLSLAAYDGLLDFAGPSGALHTFTGATGTGVPSNSMAIHAPYSVDAFRGPPGAPGVATLAFQATRSLGGAFPPLDVLGACAFSGTFELTYHYQTNPTAICTGGMFDVWGSCPCGNFGLAGRGCANSVAAAGASLVVSGAPSIASDTLVLTAAGMPNSNAIFLQGDQLVDAPTPFGDGLRCVDGNLVRLGTSAIAGGSASYPSPTQLSVSARAGITAPGTRYYQTYYRNAAVFCTPETFNVTNGVALLWTP